MPAHSRTNTYRVEVSGWDCSESFFVEKTSLTWERDAEKLIFLKSNLREGSVVFMRLLQPVLPNTVPVAYQVARVELTDEQHGKGLRRVTLEQLRTRSGERAVELPASGNCLGPQAV